MSVLYKIKDLDLRILRMFQSDGNKLCDRLTPSQIRIITYLCENKVLYQKDIEKNLNLSRATISGILSTMEKNNIFPGEQLILTYEMEGHPLSTEMLELAIKHYLL